MTIELPKIRIATVVAMESLEEKLQRLPWVKIAVNMVWSIWWMENQVSTGGSETEKTKTKLFLSKVTKILSLRMNQIK